MKRSVVFLAGWVSLFACAAADARVCKDVDFPEQVQVKGTDLHLNGLGMRKVTFLKVNVYVAALYVPRTSRFSGHPRRRCARNAESARLAYRGR
jgi:hypothetical protein